MEAVLKASLFVGAVLLLGAGLFSRWIGAELSSATSRKRLYWGLTAGAALLVLASVAEITTTVQRAVGGFYPDLIWDYLLHTRHGQATLARGGLTALLVTLGLGGRLPRTVDRLSYGLGGLGLLASLSIVSHSGAMGPLPFLGDLAHLIGATLWAGALLYFAWAPNWTEAKHALVSAVSKVSSLGVFGVAVLTLTGLYTSTLHLYGVEALTTTSYGLTLLAKVGLVLVILAIAGANRWLFMPRLEREGQTSGLRRAVRLESVLLVAVLGATGVLSTREPAHDHRDHGAQHSAAHDLNGHDSHVTPEPGAQVNVLDLAGDPASVEPLLEANGAFALVVRGEGLAEADFSVVDPSGDLQRPDAELVPTHHGTDELWLRLPALASGRWELLGPAGERLSFTVHQGELEGGSVTAFFLPTPSLAGGGLSEVFVYQDGNANERPLFMHYRMPGMDHASDDERFELERDPSYHDGRAQARRATLSFPMVGAWEVALLFGEEGEEQRFTLEMLAD
ncbi:MAG: CopD family protein [Deinococcota bacterium]|nr:CopD family protein [Deinococcota bacterium]